MGHLRPAAATHTMAPPTNHLKPAEEEWREIFNRLTERFPTVPGARIAQALRDHHGHAGEAASVLRDLTSSTVKEADPDDVEHVSTLLSSPAMFKHACKEQFRKFDINKDGVLEWDEAKCLVNTLYEEFGLQVPSEGSLKAFFYATDENQDGVLSEREFRKFFEMFLRYAFFDHLKLRQMVEKGQAIQQHRESLVSVDGAAVRKMATEVRDDADTSSPLDSRASSASTGSKPNKAPTPDETTQAPPVQKVSSKSLLAPIDQPKASGARKSPPSGQDKHHDRNHHRERRQEKERDRVAVQDNAEASFGPAYRCLAPHGVAYRASPAFQDRTDVAVSKGETVRVLEHWVRTPDGWLPVLDPQGQSLFERCSPDDDSGHKDNNIKKRVSIQEERDDTLDANVRSAGHSPAHSQNGAAEGGGGSGGGLKSNEEEWRPVFERLSQRFPQISQDKIVQALRDNEGHAGKAASMLRYM